MPPTNKLLTVAFSLWFFILLSGCNPKAGADDWCTTIKEKPSSEWTIKEVNDYSKNCFLK